MRSAVVVASPRHVTLRARLIDTQEGVGRGCSAKGHLVSRDDASDFILEERHVCSGLLADGGRSARCSPMNHRSEAHDRRRHALAAWRAVERAI